MKKTLPFILLILLPALTWGQSVVVTIHHLPITDFTIYRVDETYTLTRQMGFAYFENGQWHDTIASSRSLHLSIDQRNRIIHSVAALIDQPADSSVGIDGNYYRFEYQVGNIVWHGESFNDTPDSVADYLYSLFDLPGALYIDGLTAHHVSDSLACLDPDNCWESLPLSRIMVFDTTGKPVASTLSDGQGRFNIDILPGHYSMVVTHPGYKMRVLTGIDLHNSLELIPLLLQPEEDIFEEEDRPKVGVVLSGGGAKGVAHISALKAIEQAGIPIDIITGTSMGALIGGLYSIGWTTDELDSLVRHQDWTYLLMDRIRPEDLDIDTRRQQNIYPLWHAFSPGKRNEGAGFFRGINLDHLFDRLLVGYLDSLDFNTLPISFACVATDVITNTEIDFHSGYLKQAMRASMSIPGVFSPVRMGNMLLVDGGMRNNYPADIARNMGADIIIGVTVQDDSLIADDINGPVDLLMQIIDINCKNKYNANLAMSDILMQVDVDGYSAASFTTASIDTLLRRGAEEANRHSKELESLGQYLHNKYGIQSIARPPHTSPSRISEASTNKLSAPNPLLNAPIVGVTFRFDNEETGALQIAAQYPFFWHVPMEIGARLRLGKRLQLGIEHKFYPHGITSPTLNYSFQRNDIDIYSNGVRTFNIKYNHHTVQFTPLNSRFRLYKIRAGLQFDYYNYFDPILSANLGMLPLDNQRFFSYFFQSLLNTEDDYYFPLSGNHFLVNFAYHTDNFATFNDQSGIPDLSLLWRISLSPTDNFTLQPGIFSRMLFSDHMPIAYLNVLGTRQQIVEQQIEFPGVHSLVQIDRYLIGINLKTRLQLIKRHYLLLHGAMAINSGDLEDLIPTTFDLTSSLFLYGVSVGYAYRSFLGPIEAHVGYSTLAPGINFYLSIGHTF